MTTPRPGELTRVESKDLLRQIAVFGDPFLALEAWSFLQLGAI